MIGWIIFGVSILVVLATSLFKTINLNSRLKAAIAIVLSIVAGGVTIWITKNGDFTTSNIVEVIGLIYASSQIIYNFILKGTTLDQKLTAVTIGKSANKTGE